MNTQDNKQMEAERELDAAWDAYAKKSGLLVDGVAQDPAKTQTAFFAFEYAWKAKPAAPQPPVAVGVENILREICEMQEKNYGNGIETHIALDDLCKRARAALAATPSEAAPAGQGEAKQFFYTFSNGEYSDYRVGALCICDHEVTQDEWYEHLRTYRDALTAERERLRAMTGDIFDEPAWTEFRTWREANEPEKSFQKLHSMRVVEYDELYRDD